MRTALLLSLGLAAWPVLAHEGHAHGPLDGPLHHLVAPALVVAACVVAGAVAYWRARRK